MKGNILNKLSSDLSNAWHSMVEDNAQELCNLEADILTLNITILSDVAARGIMSAMLVMGMADKKRDVEDVFAKHLSRALDEYEQQLKDKC